MYFWTFIFCQMFSFGPRYFYFWTWFLMVRNSSCIGTGVDINFRAITFKWMHAVHIDYWDMYQVILLLWHTVWKFWVPPRTSGHANIIWHCCSFFPCKFLCYLVLLDFEVSQEKRKCTVCTSGHKCCTVHIGVSQSYQMYFRKKKKEKLASTPASVLHWCSTISETFYFTF